MNRLRNWLKGWQDRQERQRLRRRAFLLETKIAPRRGVFIPSAEGSLRSFGATREYTPWEGEHVEFAMALWWIRQLQDGQVAPGKTPAYLRIDPRYIALLKEHLRPPVRVVKT